MRRITRRDFLSKSSIGFAGVAAGVTFLMGKSGRTQGPNERVNVALIGCGGRGRYVARGMIEQGAYLIYLCDLHEGRLEKASQFLSDVQELKPWKIKDMRRVFDDKDVDAVIIATPDHWHALASILACQAGKDVFVEKPHSHNIWESQKMVEAARKYDRVVQVGTQNRSGPYNLAALDYIKSGKLGGIHLVKVYNLKPGERFEMGASGTQPDGFDWDAWLGPATERPYHQRLFKGGWHKFWDFSGGDMADDGIHQIDLAMMLMGDPELPSAVSCSGGRLAHKGDDAEVPDVQIVSFDFDTFVMTFELTNYPRYMRKTTGTIRRNDLFPYWTQNATRIELYGSELMMTIGRQGGGWQVTTSGGKVVDQMYGRHPDPHHQKNFIDCVKNRNRPNADIQIAHPSCVLVHIGNIAHHVGNQKLRFHRDKERFIDHPEANNLLKREYGNKYNMPDPV